MLQPRLAEYFKYSLNWNVQTLKRAIDEIGADNIKVIFDLYNYLDAANYKKYLEIGTSISAFFSALPIAKVFSSFNAPAS